MKTQTIHTTPEEFEYKLKVYTELHGVKNIIDINKEECYFKIKLEE